MLWNVVSFMICDPECLQGNIIPQLSLSQASMWSPRTVIIIMHCVVEWRESHQVVVLVCGVGCGIAGTIWKLLKKS